ncbi:transcriptional repressor [Parabacteroides sp. OttesenSCG-928-N08]|nr:transcriptional repressor [Parabacteroides sp. OttesenSCG-928-N08]
MDDKQKGEIREQFLGFLLRKRLRKTEERYRILDTVLSFSGHFDIDTLQEALIRSDEKFRISKATLYNTLDLFVDAGILVPHQITSRAVQYELKILADTHQHLICTKCGVIREVKTQTLHLTDLKKLKITRFTPEFYCLYVYGICSKCAYRMRIKK